jgi:hypothetical protein
MVLDGHRKIDLMMCYNCGYIEGRTVDSTRKRITNYEHLLRLNLNESAAFLAKGLGVSEKDAAAWLERVSA